jgi:hypothetical protein
MVANKPIDEIHAMVGEIRKTDAFTRYLEELKFDDEPLSEAAGDLDPDDTAPVIAMLTELIS